jgi:site-specific DNA-methyltransferase (adenine-specific)
MKLDFIECRDCVEGMRELPDNCIDLTVTSPPYDNLRKYKGFSFDFESVARELYRITKNGGVVVWVVGDQTMNGSESGTSFRQVLRFMEIGFNLHDTMIFKKKNPLPQNHRRYEQAFEYMFVLSKGKVKTFNPITVETVNAGKKIDWGGRPTEQDAKQCRHKRGSDVRETKKEKTHVNIFEYAIGGGNTKHPAVFPEQLAYDHIISWSNEGDVVFDPFMGSGTTAKMARQCGRHYIGFEISEEYCEMARARIA